MRWQVIPPINWQHPQTKQRILVILSGILVLTLFYTLKLAPAIERERRLKQRTEQLMLQLEELKQYQNYQTRFEEEATKMANQLQVVEQALPLQWDLAQLTQYLFNVVQKSRLHLNKQTILPEMVFEHYAELNIQMELTGQYHQLLAFVHGVKQLQILVNIRKLYVENPVLKGRAPELQMRANLSIYRRQPLE